MTEAAPKKIRIGWFSFSCCEDNTVVMTEVLNDHWQEWLEIFDIRYAPVLQSHNILDELDIAFVEGAIASESHAAELRNIRSRTKKLVAIGSCAIVGMPSGQRNAFPLEQQEEIQFLIDRFGAMPRVQKVADIVRVDAEVYGCPMDPDKFLAAVNTLVAEFRA